MKLTELDKIKAEMSFVLMEHGVYIQTNNKAKSTRYAKQLWKLADKVYEMGKKAGKDEYLRKVTKAINERR